MNNWTITFHHALQFRLLGMTLLLGALVTFGAVWCGLRVAFHHFARRTQHGIPICQRQSS